MSDKKILPAFLLCFLLGVLGAHRFYVGRNNSGALMIVLLCSFFIWALSDIEVLMIATVAGLIVWALIDLIMIISGSFTDKNGNQLKKWT